MLSINVLQTFYNPKYRFSNSIQSIKNALVCLLSSRTYLKIVAGECCNLMVGNPHVMMDNLTAPATTVGIQIY